MIDIINKFWYWTGVNAKEIINTNEFGNIIFKSDRNEFWRICPEELSCSLIAKTLDEYERITQGSDFTTDWEMKTLVDLALCILGRLNSDEKYCLKLPAVLGGEYKANNLGKITFKEQIEFAGELGKKIKDLPDGTKINFKFE
jgi:hypothetical protein